jgi:hypothetical protein
MQTKLKQPRSQLAEVLYGLIVSNEISERDYSQNGFRSRLTDLRNLGLNIRYQWKEFKSKYDHPGKYKTHYLWLSQKEKAKRIYERINK